jgi:hypothetical protein
MTSQIKFDIVDTLQKNNGELRGTEKLKLQLNADKEWMLKVLRNLQKGGDILIIQSRGGRGCMTVYRCSFSKCGTCECSCPRKAKRVR